MATVGDIEDTLELYAQRESLALQCSIKLRIL